MLTSSLVDWYKEKSRPATTVNLDPGALSLPYEPDVDIREMIDLQTLMESYSLGPNGALILATDLIASRLGEVQEQIDEISPDFLIVDTPGQIELFAFRDSGPFIAKNLKTESKSLLFLIDSQVASNPTNFLSLALLSAAAQLRINLPQIPVLSKIDLAPTAFKEIVKWSRDPAHYEQVLSNLRSGEEYVLFSQLFRSLKSISFSIGLYPVSAYTREGFVALLGEISRITEAGEDPVD